MTQKIPDPSFSRTQESGPHPPPPSHPQAQAPSPSSPRTQESGLQALALPDLEEPGEDVKLEDGHMAAAGEVDSGAQGQGRAAKLHGVADAQKHLKLSPGQHTPRCRGVGGRGLQVKPLGG